jgi:hypothetical protein
MRLRDLLFCVLLVGGVSLRASAAPIIYTDAAAFDAAAGQTHSIRFDETPTYSMFDYSNFFMYLTFDNLVGFGSDITGASQLNGSGVQLDGNGGGVTTLEPITGFGFDIAYSWENSRIRIWGVGDPNGTMGYDIPEGSTFFGVLFDEPTVITITSEVGVTAGARGYRLDDLRIRTVPEPSTLLLLGLGVCAVARRRPYRHAE